MSEILQKHRIQEKSNSRHILKGELYIHKAKKKNQTAILLLPLGTMLRKYFLHVPLFHSFPLELLKGSIRA